MISDPFFLKEKLAASYTKHCSLEPYLDMKPLNKYLLRCSIYLHALTPLKVRAMSAPQETRLLEVPNLFRSVRQNELSFSTEMI